MEDRCAAPLMTASPSASASAKASANRIRRTDARVRRNEETRHVLHHVDLADPKS
jgi:hypothetical protein